MSEEAFYGDEFDNPHKYPAFTVTSAGFVRYRPMTRVGAGLLFGRQTRNGYRAPGLSFAFNALERVEAGIETDDPFADQLLLDLELKMTGTYIDLSGRLGDVTKRLGRSGLSGDFIDDDFDRKAWVTNRTMGARLPLMSLAAMADNLMFLAGNIYNKGRLSKAERADVYLIGPKAVRSIYHMLATYRYKGVCRQDIELMTRKGQQAIDHFGYYPDPGIMSEDVYSRYAPEIADDETDGQIATGAVRLANQPLAARMR